MGQLISDRSLVAQAYGFDQAEQGTLMETYLSRVYNTREQSYTDLSMDDYGQQLWQAVKADFDAGNIGKRYLFDDEERSENTYVTDLYFLWGRLNKDGEQEGFYRSVTVTLTPQAANTLAVLESTGLLGDDYQLQPHSRTAATMTMWTAAGTDPPRRLSPLNRTSPTWMTLPPATVSSAARMAPR